MVLEKETKIVQSQNAYTQYIVIPAAMARDSQYPFKEGERVRLTVDPYRRMMIVSSVEGPCIEVSREGIFVKGKKIEVVKK